MAERIVINTGPLVALARAELLDVPGKLDLRFIYPPEVEQEISEGVAQGYPDARPQWVERVALSKPVDAVARATLDLGEAAVIQLALEQRIAWVCIDDRKGRRAALAVGLKVTGTLGLLARAKKLGVISSLRPLVEKLQRVGAYHDDELVRRVLEGAGE
jgi:predicted nucleic acid-binding protein